MCVLLGAYCQSAIFTLSSLIIFSFSSPKFSVGVWLGLGNKSTRLGVRKDALGLIRHFHNVNQV